jgi:hypothetical protein
MTTVTQFFIVPFLSRRFVHIEMMLSTGSVQVHVDESFADDDGDVLPMLRLS